MTLFASTLEQMAYLLLLLFLGWFLVKKNVLPDTAASILSRLESNLFIPALMFATFAKNFTPDRIGTAGRRVQPDLSRNLFIRAEILAFG